MPIAVPPLRERLDDIPMLAAYFVDKHAGRMGRSIDALEDGVVKLLQQHDWPGNVRELENTIERAVVLTTGSRIARDAVTIEASRGARAMEVPSLSLHQNVEWVERETIRRALAISPAKQHAARMMGITPRALSYYLSKYRLVEEGQSLA